jgi:hypothetical protein
MLFLLLKITMCNLLASSRPMKIQVGMPPDPKKYPELKKMNIWSCSTCSFIITTSCTAGNPGFAESRKLSAKAIKPSAKALPRVALGTGLTDNFFSATTLCRAPELEALSTGGAESLQWAVGQKK